MPQESWAGGLCRGVARELGTSLEQVLPAAAKSQSTVNAKACWRFLESRKSEGGSRQLRPQDPRRAETAVRRNKYIFKKKKKGQVMGTSRLVWYQEWGARSVLKRLPADTQCGRGPESLSKWDQHRILPGQENSKARRQLWAGMKTIGHRSPCAPGGARVLERGGVEASPVTKTPEWEFLVQTRDPSLKK